MAYQFYKLRDWIPIDMLDWASLSANPNAIHLLEANQDNIDWSVLSENPSIFTYDYKAIKERMLTSGLAEDLMKNRFHPKYMEHWINWGHEDPNDFE